MIIACLFPRFTVKLAYVFTRFFPGKKSEVPDILYIIQAIQTFRLGAEGYKENRVVVIGDLRTKFL